MRVKSGVGSKFCYLWFPPPKKERNASFLQFSEDSPCFLLFNSRKCSFDVQVHDTFEYVCM